MEAVEFLKERIRMCSSYKDCMNCPFENSDIAPCWIQLDTAQQAVTIVEQWAKDNP